MEITDLRWLEPKPTWKACEEEKLSYHVQLLIRNLSAVGTRRQTKPATLRAQTNPLRFDVSGSFNGRLFDCRLSLSASDMHQSQWKDDLAQKLRLCCRAYGNAPAPVSQLA